VEIVEVVGLRRETALGETGTVRAIPDQDVALERFKEPHGGKGTA
jgi:hypothetical protein